MWYVVVAIVVGVLLADRIGTREEVSRRLFQVALGFTLALAVAAVSIVVFPLEVEEGTSFVSNGDDGNNHAERIRQGATLIAVAGLALVFVGVSRTKAWPTLHLGFILGGLLLLLSQLDTSDVAAAAIYGISTYAGATMNALYAVVLVTGAACLCAYGYKTWEQRLGALEDDSRAQP